MTATDIVKPVLGGARVLVVEGDADDSVALTAVLRLNGFDAREARTEKDAILAATETEPAVVVVDLDLPGGDGCGLIRRVRRVTKPPAVVVVTAHTAPGVRRAALDAGAAAYLLKPADPTELARLVGQLSEGQ
jgi:DNA-binding response OmpR family regulator